MRPISTALTIQVPEFDVGVHAARHYSVGIALVKILLPSSQDGS
jgi:hypothetical protein